MQRSAFLSSLVLSVIALSAPAARAADDPALHGIEVNDLDRSVKPCDDFFEFANGGWRAAHPIPPSMVRWSRRWEAGETAKDRLKVILDEVSAKKDWPAGSPEQLIGDYYGACMDETTVNAAGAKPIAPLLADIEAIKDQAGVQAMIARLRDLTIAAPFATYGSSDNHEPTNVIAQIAASGLGLPDRDYYVKTDARFVEARDKYQAHVARMFALAGRSAADSQAAAERVFAFEKQLAEASLDNVALRDPAQTDHKMSVAELQKLTPRFDWNGYLASAKVAPADLNVNEPKFMQEFDKMLAGAPLPAWKAYLEWHVLDSAAPFLSSNFVTADYEFNQQYLGGSKEMKPRWKRCVETNDDLLGEALGRKYVEKYFPPAAKARMQELVKNLLLAMGDIIGELDWMSAPTKAKALEKLATFNPKVGYPDKWKDYGSVRISRADFWSDVVAGRNFQVADNLATIGKPVDRGAWGMTPPTSNAYYNPSLNEIVFPAGILEPPAFSLEATDAVNYGAIGVVIGHEISHGFDDQGAQYDAQGRLQNWWSDEDLKKFTARGQCVVDQFNGYFIEPGIHHDGKLVLGESIGDLAGARIAYRALRRSLAGKPEPPPIDGFTTDQQFFVAWGQFRGDAVRPETQRLMVQSDPHPIGKFRVIGPLSNLKEFQKAFSCPAGAPMVRAEKACEVW